jgi:hypothetical protein
VVVIKAKIKALVEVQEAEVVEAKVEVDAAIKVKIKPLVEAQEAEVVEAKVETKAKVLVEALVEPVVEAEAETKAFLEAQGKAVVEAKAETKAKVEVVIKTRIKALVEVQEVALKTMMKCSNGGTMPMKKMHKSMHNALRIMDINNGMCFLTFMQIGQNATTCHLVISELHQKED